MNAEQGLGVNMAHEVDDSSRWCCLLHCLLDGISILLETLVVLFGWVEALTGKIWGFWWQSLVFILLVSNNADLVGFVTNQNPP